MMRDNKKVNVFMTATSHKKKVTMITSLNSMIYDDHRSGLVVDS